MSTPPSSHVPSDSASKGMTRLDGVLVPDKLKHSKARKALDQIASHLPENEQLRVVVNANRLRKPTATWVAVTNLRLLLLFAESVGRLAVTWSATAGQVVVKPASTGANWSFSAIAIATDDSRDSFKVPLQHGGAGAVVEAFTKLAALDPSTSAAIHALEEQTTPSNRRLSKLEAADWIST
jgi:hypothetical protein